MRIGIIFILCGILSICQIDSQNNDSIFLLGCEDNWDNVEEYKNIIITKIGSILSNDTSYSKNKTYKIILSFSIDENGNMKDFNFKENSGINYKIDSVIVDNMISFKFRDAAVYNPCTQKRYLINFTFPITIVGKQPKEQSINE